MKQSSIQNPAYRSTFVFSSVIAIIYFGFFFLFCFSTALSAPREFKPTPGFVILDSLPPKWKAKVIGIQFVIKDAFEGTKAYQPGDSLFWELGNKLHWESSESTIRKRLLFKINDSVDKLRLQETARNLRNEEFLADAVLEIRNLQESGLCVIKVTTFDQWTTSLPLSAQFIDGKLVGLFGITESNLLGSGQRLGFFIQREQFRNSILGEYKNYALTPLNLQSTLLGARTSDGYQYLVALQRPLRSKSQLWGYGIQWDGSEETERYFQEGKSLYQLNEVNTHHLKLSAVRSMGYRHKFNLISEYDRKDRYQKSHSLSYPQGIIRGVNHLLGGGVHYIFSDYKTLANFRNLKWSEDLELGLRLSSKFFFNLDWEDRRDGPWFMSHSLAFSDQLHPKILLLSLVRLDSYLLRTGALDNGVFQLNVEATHRRSPSHASYMNVSYTGLIQAPPLGQLSLGEINGLNGYPNQFFNGDSRFLLELEERWFPPFEIMAQVPALAIFYNGGNCYPQFEKPNFKQLNHSLGIGFRIGNTKSVQKVINHINISWPLDERFQGNSPWLLYGKFSLRAKATL